VAELLREVRAEAVTLVANEDRADPREGSRRRQALEVEVGEPAGELLALEGEAGEGSGRVVGAHTVRPQPIGGLRGVVIDEQEPAPRREPNELFSIRRLDEIEVAADLHLSVGRKVADDLRADAGERPRERRGERLRRAARRRQKGKTHERIRSPAGSKNAPCVTRAPRSWRSTRISNRVPSS